MFATSSSAMAIMSFFDSVSQAFIVMWSGLPSRADAVKLCMLLLMPLMELHMESDGDGDREDIAEVDLHRHSNSDLNFGHSRLRPLMDGMASGLQDNISSCAGSGCQVLLQCG